METGLDGQRGKDRSGTNQLEAFSDYVTCHVSGHFGSIAAISLVMVWIAVHLWDHESAYSDLLEKAATMMSLVLLFLVQRSQTKDTLSLQMKLNELIEAIGPADSGMIDIESRSEEDLQQLHEEKARGGSSSSQPSGQP